MRINIISEKTCQGQDAVWCCGSGSGIGKSEFGNCIYSGLKIPKSLFNDFDKTVRTWNFQF